MRNAIGDQTNFGKMLRIIIGILLLIMIKESSQAQSTKNGLDDDYIKVDKPKPVLVEGIIKDSKTKLPLDSVEISIPRTDFETIYSDNQGRFKFIWGENSICNLIYEKHNYFILNDKIETKSFIDTIRITRFLKSLK